MNKFFFFVLLMFVSGHGFCQEIGIKGVVLDSASQKIDQGHIHILSLKDSSCLLIQPFNNGEFEFTGIQESNFILVVSSTGYHPLYNNMSLRIDPNKIYNLDKLFLMKTTTSPISVIGNCVEE